VRSYCERLENVSASAESTVDQHGNVPSDGLDDFRQDIHRAAPRLGRSPPMIRNNNAIDAMFAREDRIVGRIDTL